MVVLNGVGHDDFAERMIASSEKPGIPVIEANAKVPLLAATGMAARGAGKVVNPHTFLSISASITQVNTIARELGKLDPANAKAYTRNARAYAKRLRALRADALARLNKAPAADFRVATIHGAYDYLLREFGLEVTAVVEPAHGIEPSPSQLKKTIDQLKALDVKVIFSEIDFPSTYVETIQRESGVKLYSLSHISYGDYSAGKYEEEMARNLDTVVRAIQGPAHDRGRTALRHALRAGHRLRRDRPEPRRQPHPRWRAPARRGRQRARAGRAERRRQSSLVKTLLGQMPHRGELRLGGPARPAASATRAAGAGVRPRPAAHRRRFHGCHVPAPSGLPRPVAQPAPGDRRGPGTGRHAGQARSAHGRPLRRRAPARAAGPGPGTAAATAGAGRTDVGPRRGRHPGLRAAAAGLAQAGVTVLWIEHDLEAVGRLADRSAVSTATCCSTVRRPAA